MGPALAAAHRRSTATGWRSTSWPVETGQGRARPRTRCRGRTRRRGAGQAQARLPADGIVTAGSASPLSDGAGAIVVASGEAVERHGLTPRARVVASASAGVPPHIMGLGPVPSTREGPRALRAGRSRDLDAVEINEAFATQVIASIRRLGPRPGDRQRLRRRDRARPSARRVGRPARARPPGAPGGRRAQARPGDPVHRRRAGDGAHRRACLRARETLSRDTALR